MQKQLRPKRLSLSGFYISEGDLNNQRLIVGGLAAFSLIIVQAFIATGLTDPASYISVFAFAVALPLMVLHVYYYGTLKLLTTTMAPAYVMVLFLGSLILDTCGIDAAIWHISWIAGLLFIISGLVGFFAFSSNAVRVRSRDKNPLSRLE
jgi:hypothetical protein